MWGGNGRGGVGDYGTFAHEANVLFCNCSFTEVEVRAVLC